MRARIVAAAVVTVGAALVVAGLVLVLLVRRSLEHPMRGEARARAADVVATMTVVPPPRTLPALAAPWPSLAQVIADDGSIVAASAELRGRAPLLRTTPARREPSGQATFASNGRQQHWRLDAVAASLRGRPVTVVVATSLAQVERSTRLVTVSLAVGLPILLALVGWLAWLLVGRALRPVESLRRQVGAFEQRPAGRRVDALVADDEIGRLAGTLNELLDRLERASRQQGRFVADASHELRSPVANIRAALEVATAHPTVAPWPEVVADVLEQNERMGRLVDDLLLLARTGAGAPAERVERVDLADLVRRVVTVPVATRVPVRVHAPAGVWTRGDPTQLERVVENLVANAVRHAAEAVTVTVASVGRWCEVTVTDDGAGVAAADRERVFLPFVRLDTDRSRRGGGSGLGLAIVADVVAAHAGTITVGDAHPGAVFTVRFPADRLSGSP